MRTALLAALLLALLATACGGKGDSAGPAEEQPAGTLYGVAGLIPPRWPNPSPADWQTLFTSFSETGPLVGAYQGWDQKQPIELVYSLAKDEDITPVIALGVARDTASGGVEPTFNLRDPIARRAFIDNAVDLVKQHQVAYLLIGTEVDRLQAADAAAFDAFVSLYVETYDAVKAASPKTVVFTAFQLEMLRGAAYLSGRTWQERWSLLDRFTGKLDLAAFTTYPFFDYETPAAIPADYYTAIARHTSLPVAFMEIGWPSAPLSAAPTSAYGGDPVEQAAFVRRFAELTAGLDVRLALWSFSYDPGPSVASLFQTIGLRENGGAPKPALEAWKEIRRR